MTTVAELLTTVNRHDAQRVSLESNAQGTFLKIEELTHAPNNDGSDNWQPRAMIRLTDAIEMTRAMIQAVKLLDPEELGQDEPVCWDDGAMGRDEIGDYDWEGYIAMRERELDEMSDALADAMSAHALHD